MLKPCIFKCSISWQPSESRKRRSACQALDQKPFVDCTGPQKRGVLREISPTVSRSPSLNLCWRDAPEVLSNQMLVRPSSRVLMPLLLHRPPEPQLRKSLYGSLRNLCGSPREPASNPLRSGLWLHKLIVPA